MKRMKKPLGVMAVLLLTASLAGCGKRTATDDTILWFNASHAVLTRLNGWDVTLFGEIPANAEGQEAGRQLLEEWWGVTDRQSADETMDWILEEGHRVEFGEVMDYYGTEGLAETAEADRTAWLYSNFDMTEDEAKAMADWYALYEADGEKTIAAWDYSRAMSLLGYYYIAGYYSETEALDKSLEVAAKIQNIFSSWDEFMESYLTGYEYWANESSNERRAVYAELKAEEDSLYNLAFDMTLEKSW